MNCKTLVCLSSVSNSFLSFLRVYKVPSDPPLCYFLPKEKEKDEPHNRHMLSAWTGGGGAWWSKRQEAHPEEAGFSEGQGLGDLGGRGPGTLEVQSHSISFLLSSHPQSLNAG